MGSGATHRGSAAGWVETRAYQRAGRLTVCCMRLRRGEGADDRRAVVIGPPAAREPDCSARPRSVWSNSSKRSGANRDTSDRQRVTCSTAVISALRLAGAFPVATACAWPARRMYQALARRESIEFLRHVARPLVDRRQQPELVERPEPHLAQYAMRKRFRRNLDRCRCHHTCRGVNPRLVRA